MDTKVLRRKVGRTTRRIVARVMVLFTSCPNAFFALRVRRADTNGARHIFRVVKRLILRAYTWSFTGGRVRSIAFPPTVRVAFTWPRETFLRGTFGGVKIFRAGVHQNEAIGNCANATGWFINSAMPIIVQCASFFCAQ